MTNFYKNIYTVVINLPKEDNRRKFMENQLTSLSIPYTVLEAVDGKTYNFNGVYDEAQALLYHGAPLSLPEKGCALSHRNALVSFLDSGKEFGLILEDDVLLGKDFPSALQYTLKQAKLWSYVQFNYGPVGWQGVRLWWFLFFNDRKKRTFLEGVITLIKGIIANLISLMWGIRNMWYHILGKGKLCKIVRDQYLAGCYLVTRDSARTLIELNTPLTYTADRIQNIARRKKLIRERVYVPRIVRQKREHFTSSINNDHFGKDIISA